MWWHHAFLSALFATLTAVLAWGIVYFRGGLAVPMLTCTNLLFLELSGLATGVS